MSSVFLFTLFMMFTTKLYKISTFHLVTRVSLAFNQFKCWCRLFPARLGILSKLQLSRRGKNEEKNERKIRNRLERKKTISKKSLWMTGGHRGVLSQRIKKGSTSKRLCTLRKGLLRKRHFWESVEYDKGYQSRQPLWGSSINDVMALGGVGINDLMTTVLNGVSKKIQNFVTSFTNNPF